MISMQHGTVLACRLPENLILDRVEMISMVEPDAAKQASLYADAWHFSAPDVYHAFNWQLLEALPPPAPVADDLQSSGCMPSMHVPFAALTLFVMMLHVVSA
jgi:hypothetical protein